MTPTLDLEQGRRDVLAEYRRRRLAEYRRRRSLWRSMSPYTALAGIRDQAADAYAAGASLGVAPDDQIQLRDLARYVAAREYANSITGRCEAQAERRGCHRYETFWHHGRIGGVS